MKRTGKEVLTIDGLEEKLGKKSKNKQTNKKLNYIKYPVSQKQLNLFETNLRYV